MSNFDYDFAEVEEFIWKVFNFYNGRINKMNYPAKLEINWCDIKKSSVSGYSLLPNVVVINPLVINKYFPDSLHFYDCILETIIHELFHTDQIIDCIRIVYDKGYEDYIEDAVEVETSLYMLQHQQEIIDNFGMYVDTSQHYHKLLMFDNGAHYQRAHYHDHVFSLIQTTCNILPSDDNYATLMDIIQNSIINPNKGLIVILNGHPIAIQCNGTYMPTSTVNEVFYENFYKFSHHRRARLSFDNYGTFYQLKIDVECKNIMAQER